ncbi:unnamed protein product [Protopolystoma xenopodis]|uniref:Uncharacterized protein n=1 Tax=Protopolystoma xenopodis TaxID=117903 RepID=A0A3S5B534_9PLAT|nr:unnamed protein product [Protopolystoma xenopodis]
MASPSAFPEKINSTSGPNQAAFSSPASPPIVSYPSSRSLSPISSLVRAARKPVFQDPLKGPEHEPTALALNSSSTAVQTIRDGLVRLKGKLGKSLPLISIILLFGLMESKL